MDPLKNCQCGKPATKQSLELSEFFSKVYSPQCYECEEKEAEEERKHKRELDDQRRRVEQEARLEVIPPEMRRTRASHPHFNAGLWVRVEGWKPSLGKWLGIVGGAGRSKTRVLSLLAARLILSGHRVKWTTATELQEQVDELTKGGPSERRNAVAYLAECKKTSILILDDLGKNTWTPSFEKNLFHLLDHRKTHDLPILWTANSTPREILASGELTKDRGGPIMGRLLEASTIETA